MTDMLDLHSVQIVDAPADIANWTVTTDITRLEIQPSKAPKEGVSLEFAAQARWPGVIPAGWGPNPQPADRIVLDPHVDGAIQYTVWAGFKINGAWVASAFIQMWAGRPSTGAPILSDFAKNWAYADRWGPLKGYQPQVGEQMLCFVSAGNARDGRSVTTVFERSDAVLIALPPGDSGVFTFEMAPVPVQPPPAPVPVPQPPAPGPMPADDIEAKFLDALERTISGLTDVRTGIDALVAKIDDLKQNGIPAKLSF